MIVFRCDKKYQMFTLLKEKQYQVTFLCEKNESIILHHLTGKAKTLIYPKLPLTKDMLWSLFSE